MNRRARKVVVVVVVVVNSVKEKDTWFSRIKLRKKLGEKKIENEDLKLIGKEVFFCLKFENGKEKKEENVYFSFLLLNVKGEFLELI